jgi:hypothetical protein
MRKIVSKEEGAKKQRRNQLIVGGGLILVMLASTLGYALTRESKESSEKVIYNGFEFTKQSGFWSTNIDNYQFFFTYNPKEVPKINSALNPLSSYSGKPLYIYYENGEAATEIYRNLFYQNQIAERMQDACLKGEKCESNSPIKTCEDNFIIIKESENEKITQNNSCVFIEGSSENLTKLSDGFLFDIVGITQ